MAKRCPKSRPRPRSRNWAERGGLRFPRSSLSGRIPRTRADQPLALPVYKRGEKEATRQAYGDALAALGASLGDMVVLDGEVSNSTHSGEFEQAFPNRFFQMFIAEQQMLGAAVGLGLLGKKAFASTFAAFLTRTFDQIRMAAVSNADLRLCGSHAGVSIGEDGPSQMALEDLAMMRAVFGSTVLYPCDANQTARLVARTADLSGISYLRTTRAKTDVVYDEQETFEVGGSKTLRRSEHDDAAVIAAGITVHEAVKACDQLEADGIHLRVIDAYSVKPIDRETLREAAHDVGGRLIVAEDHWPEGGLGAAVREALDGNGGVPDGGAARNARAPGGSPDARFRFAGGAAGRGRDRRRSHRRGGASDRERSLRNGTGARQTGIRSSIMSGNSVHACSADPSCGDAVAHRRA